MKAKRVSEIDMSNYNPPLRPDDVDSEAEFSLAHHFRKFFACKLTPQYQVGRYRVDFECKGIGIEVDGKKWHDTEQDSKRDQEILSMDLKCIVRFEAQHVLFQPRFCCWFLYKKFPDIRDRHVNFRRDLQLNGIYTEQDHLHAITRRSYGYTILEYEVDYMSGENERRYFNDMEMNYEDERWKDLSNYTRKKNIDIKLMKPKTEMEQATKDLYESPF